jgi:hypothetical protein
MYIFGFVYGYSTYGSEMVVVVVIMMMLQNEPTGRGGECLKTRK